MNIAVYFFPLFLIIIVAKFSIKKSVLHDLM